MNIMLVGLTWVRKNELYEKDIKFNVDTIYYYIVKLCYDWMRLTPTNKLF